MMTRPLEARIGDGFEAVVDRCHTIVCIEWYNYSCTTGLLQHQRSKERQGWNIRSVWYHHHMPAFRPTVTRKFATTSNFVNGLLLVGTAQRGVVCQPL